MHVYKKPFTRLVEEGTYITSHEGELLNSKNEWHQARSWLKPQRKSSKEEQNCCKEEEKEKEEIPWELPSGKERKWQGPGTVKYLYFLSESMSAVFHFGPEFQTSLSDLSLPVTRTLKSKQFSQ